MSKLLFKPEWLSEYPCNYIPKDAEAFISVDPAGKDSDCTVKGFYKDGKLHIQEATCAEVECNFKEV